MNIIITYASKSGHTKKIAAAIGEQLNVVPINIKDNPKVQGADILLIGTGIFAGKSNPDAVSFAGSIDKDTVGEVILFSTSCSGTDSTVDLRDLLTQKGIKVNEKTFACKGQFLFFSKKRPNADDEKNAKEFAKIISR